MARTSWPYDVRPLSELVANVRELDLLVVGGGHLVRFDEDVAHGYWPAEAGLHHPTAYWLMPTIVAASQGVPVAWNGLGASPDTPGWAEEILRLAVQASTYVSVRDHESAAELWRLATGARIHVVPDSGFGIRRLLPEHESDAFRRFVDAAGVARPYVIVQPSPHFEPHAERLTEALAGLQTDGLSVVVVPIGPSIGDRLELLPAAGTVPAAGLLDRPLLVAELIARAEAVVAQSFHLTIVALTAGVAVNRIGREPHGKNALLSEFPGGELRRWC